MEIQRFKHRRRGCAGSDDVETLEARRLLSSAITALCSFGSEIQIPETPLVVDGSGNVYGTTGEGGGGYGTVFEVAKGSNTITTLIAFTGSPLSGPGALVIDSEGDLFGTALYDGAASDTGGAVFEITSASIAAGTPTVTIVASFAASDDLSDLFPDGEYPDFLVADNAGDLFGATTDGGANDDGTLFEIAQETNQITVLGSFTAPTGEPTASLVIDGSGNLYGVRQNESTDSNEVFELLHGSNTITTLALPALGVAVDGSGNLYGSLNDGGAYNDGSVFEIPAAGIADGTQDLTTLASFNQDQGTSNATAGPILDSTGDVLGTTEEGNGSGTVFEIAKGSGTATVLATFNDTDGNGPYGNLTLENSGNLYGITLEGGAFNSGTVFKIPVTGAVAANGQLAFIQQPTSAIAGNSIAPAVGVAVEDQNGNIVTSANDDVTLAIAKGPAGATLSGTATVAAVNGVATLSGLSLSDAGTYKLTATDGDLSTKSVKFTISAAAPADFSFEQNPIDVTAGKHIKPAIAVSVTDAFGNPITGKNVKLAIASGPAGAVLEGTTKVIAENGVATFSGISLTEAGNYTLSATHGAATPAVSSPFAVSAAAAELAFVQQPSSVAVGVAIAPPIAVNVEDQFGNLVTADNSNVTLVIKAGTGPAGAILDGTLTVAAQDGVATFSDISLSEAGNYKLKAKDGSLTKAKSVKFTVSAAS
jgi:uncharacterized repeat protein (TIGR03803 family)